MKLSNSVLSLFLASGIVASPIVTDSIRVDRGIGGESSSDGLEARQSTSLTANEFTNGGCKDVVLVFARGTAQLGNLGATPGLPLYNQIKSALGSSNVAVQGVNYDAVAHGTLPEGVDATAANNMATLITKVANTCPDASIIVSGYSQGAAMVHASIKRVTATVKARINAAVTFGDTRNEQDGGTIPGISADRTLIICNDGDEVCDGTLVITAAHLQYTPRVPEAVSFMQSKV
ncbi:cutinase [Pestalotiopsis sp. NC0098]|nr:cutinase [Pestalotiopsis sp. NC0098]